MLKPATFALILVLGSGSAFGQSKQATINYIIDTIKSLESTTYTVKEVFFLSPDGSVFTIRKQVSGKKERKLVIPLKDVDVLS